MDARERVKRTIYFEKPDRVPMLYFNSEKEKTDILLIRVGENFLGPNQDESEWGFVWERMDATMGQPKAAVLTDWSMLDTFRAPVIDPAKRFAHVEPEKKQYGGKDKYILANMELTGFTIMTMVRGFSELIEDMVFNPEQVNQLADIIFGFEMELMPHLVEQGFDGVAFFDDWGMQTNLMISPQMWREFFLWRYQKQFTEAHRLGLDVYFHSCGYIYPIIQDLIDAGVDMLNLSQPNLYNIENIGKEFGGQVCFVLPVSYQTTSISGTKADIFAAVEEYMKYLGSFDGGLIGYIEQYESIGLSQENYQYCIDAFREIGIY